MEAAQFAFSRECGGTNVMVRWYNIVGGEDK